jgi:hypothetical protein
MGQVNQDAVLCEERSLPPLSRSRLAGNEDVANDGGNFDFGRPTSQLIVSKRRLKSPARATGVELCSGIEAAQAGE